MGCLLRGLAIDDDLRARSELDAGGLATLVHPLGDRFELSDVGRGSSGFAELLGAIGVGVVDQLVGFGVSFCGDFRDARVLVGDDAADASLGVGGVRAHLRLSLVLERVAHGLGKAELRDGDHADLDGGLVDAASLELLRDAGAERVTDVVDQFVAVPDELLRRAMRGLTTRRLQDLRLHHALEHDVVAAVGAQQGRDVLCFDPDLRHDRGVQRLAVRVGGLGLLGQDAGDELHVGRRLPGQLEVRTGEVDVLGDIATSGQRGAIAGGHLEHEERLHDQLQEHDAAQDEGRDANQTPDAGGRLRVLLVRVIRGHVSSVCKVEGVDIRFSRSQQAIPPVSMRNPKGDRHPQTEVCE